MTEVAPSSTPSVPQVEQHTPKLNFNCEGDVLDVSPGYLYNSWQQVYLKWVDSDDISLCVFKDKTAQQCIEKILRENIKSVEISPQNELVFLVKLREPSTVSKKREFYYKVL